MHGPLVLHLVLAALMIQRLVAVCRCDGSWRLPIAAQLMRGLMQASWLVIWLRVRK
jgi:hypothetical protein